jgi:hypothetical protein
MAAATINFGDGVQATGQTNGLVVGPFVVLGGKYEMSGYSSGTYSVQLAVLTIDGTNYVNCTAAATTIGYLVVDLAPGTYQITCGGSMTTGNVSLIKIPYRAA